MVPRWPCRATHLEDSNATGVDSDQADNSATESGAVYIFARSGAVWSQQVYVKATNTGISDNFGESVAVSGDTVVIGAPGEASNATGVNSNQTDNSASFSGAAYIFDLDTDDDSVIDPFDNCPLIANPSQTNSDGDSIGDVCDNCPFLINADQSDLDGDGFGDACDADEDGDGVPNGEDVCPTASSCQLSDASGRPRSDLNLDCAVNGFDIQLLVNCIVGGGAACNTIDPDGDGNTANTDSADDIAAFVIAAIALQTVPCF